MYMLSFCRRGKRYLASTLPLTEQMTCQAVGKASLVIPEEVSSDKLAMLA